jgi:hypothetical protein
MCPGFVEPGHITSSERSGRHHLTGQTRQTEAEPAVRVRAADDVVIGAAGGEVTERSGGPGLRGGIWR